MSRDHTLNNIYSCNATPSTISIVAMATSAVSSSAAASATSSRRQCVGGAPGMLFEEEQGGHFEVASTGADHWGWS